MLLLLALATAAFPIKALQTANPAVFAVEDDVYNATTGNQNDSVQPKILCNQFTGERVDVAWSMGGMVAALVLKSPTTPLRDVILSYNRSAEDVRTLQGAKGNVLLPWANRIANGSFNSNGEAHYLIQNNGDNAIHGYLRDIPLRVVGQNASDSKAEVTLRYDFDGTDPGYPFPLSVELIYKLTLDGSALTINAWNRGDSGLALQFNMGWHPYFLVIDVSRTFVVLDTKMLWNRIRVNHTSLIPTGITTPFSIFDGSMPVGGSTKIPTTWDDGFKAVTSGAVYETRVHDPSLLDTAVLWGDRKFPWMQVFTGGVAGSGEQIVAVEPMSGQTDAFNN